MMTHARNTALAAERISRRFMEDESRRASWRGMEEPAPARAWSQTDGPSSVRPRSEATPRFDVVRGGRDEEARPLDVTPREVPTVDVRARVSSEPLFQSPAPLSGTPPPVSQSPAPVQRSLTPGRAAAWSPVSVTGQSAAVEQYRRLAAALIQAQLKHGVRVVMVTSSVAGEGKSLTAANLAVTLSRSYKRNTLIVDADQRDPSQHLIFHVDNTRGLGDYLRGHDSTPASTLQLFPGLALLPAGQPTSDPMGGLTSMRIKQLLADAAGTCDFVIVDTPPAALIPDAGIIAPLVDTTVLVISAGTTPYDAVDRAIAAIGRERILGAVLNRADMASLGRCGYGYSGR